MGKTVRLSDIGEKLGVSGVTVSKALSGKKGVSEEMRQKIITLADEMGYVRGSGRTVSRGKESYAIDVLCPEQYFTPGESFYSSLYRDTAKAAAAAGSLTALELISFEQEAENYVPRLIYKHKVDGVIVLGDLSRPYCRFLEENLRVPMIYMDTEGRFDIQDAVVSNNVMGGYRMTRYLLDLGHRRIGFVGTRLVTASIDDRFLGYCKALMECGIEIRQDWILKDRERKTNVDEYEELFRLPEDMPTAFFCNCDKTAQMLVQKLKEAGYSVPDDISVVGFDHYLNSKFSEILTTYEISQSLMAREAVFMILRKIRDPKDQPGTLILPGKFLERSSARSIGPAVEMI